MAQPGYEPVTTAYEMGTVWVPTVVDAVTGEPVDVPLGPNQGLGALPPGTFAANAPFSHGGQSMGVPGTYPAPSVYATPHITSPVYAAPYSSPSTYAIPMTSPPSFTPRQPALVHAAPPLDANMMKRKDLELQMRRAQLEIDEKQLELAKLQREHGILIGLVVER